jgi:DNA-binding transcriptional LysR family regulator
MKIMPIFLKTLNGLKANPETLTLASITSVWDYHREAFMRASDQAILDQNVTRAGHSDEIVTLVENGSVDLGIITYDLPRGSRLSRQIWDKEAMVLAASNEAARKLGIADGKDHGWGLAALDSSELRIVMLEKGYGVRDKSVDPFLIEIKRKPSVFAEFDSIAQIKDTVAAYGHLITILPLPTVEEDPRLRWASLRGIAPRVVSFIWGGNPRGTVKSFLAHLKRKKTT